MIMTVLHHTYGLYPNGEWRRNAVVPEHLQTHIEYNLGFRPGRALIVDGVLVSPGQVGPTTLEEFMRKLPELDKNWNPRTPTTPYC